MPLELPEDVKQKLAEETATFVMKTGVKTTAAALYAARMMQIVMDYFATIEEKQIVH